MFSVYTDSASSDGGWTQWSEWSSCTNFCTAAHSSAPGNQVRRRTCTNPTPGPGGRNCTAQTDGPPYEREARACFGHISPQTSDPNSPCFDSKWIQWHDRNFSKKVWWNFIGKSVWCSSHSQMALPRKKSHWKFWQYCDGLSYHCHWSQRPTVGNVMVFVVPTATFWEGELLVYYTWHAVVI